MREGCGQEVELGRLLYVCDRLPRNGTHVVHLTFEAKRILRDGRRCGQRNREGAAIRASSAGLTGVSFVTY
jgi:hypothetical protein